MGDSPCVMASQNVSKKRKFVADGVFFAELNELFTRELAEDGYSGVEVRQTPARHEIIIRATRTERAWREGPPHSRADRCRPKAFRIPSRPSSSSSWEVSPSVAHAMALSATSWRAVLRVLRSLSLASSEDSVLRL